MHDNQDQLVEQIPYARVINNVDIIKLIEDENRNDIRKLADDTSKIREIMSDINMLIDDGGEQLVVAREYVDDADIIIEDATNEINQARKSQARAIVLKATLFSIGIGLCIGGPTGAVLGYIAGKAALDGAIIGCLSLGGIFGGVGNKIYRDKQKT